MAVAAVILGILGMHALNIPGVGMPHAGAADGGHVVAASPISHDLGIQPSSDVTPTQTLHRVQIDGTPVHPMGAMLTICVGMLAAGALLIPLIRSLSRAAFVRRVRTLLHRSCRPLVATLTRAGPPHEWSYSVIRC